jgi:hypothetical protein
VGHVKHLFLNYFLFISIQLSFKSTIEFVRPNISFTNLIVNLKMRWVEDEYEMDLYHLSIYICLRWVGQYPFYYYKTIAASKKWKVIHAKHFVNRVTHCLVNESLSLTELSVVLNIFWAHPRDIDTIGSLGGTLTMRW